MSKKPWEDKVSEEESEEVVDADFLDDEDEFEDFEGEGNTSSDEDQEKSGFINLKLPFCLPLQLSLLAYPFLWP